MSLDQVTYRAFQDEIVKIGAPLPKGAVLNKLRGAGRTLKGWVRKGWDDPMNQGMVPDKVNPGKKVKGWDWWGKGKYTRHLPIGGKSVFVGLTAPAIPGVLRKKDPYGAQRSRAERSVDLGSSVVGGLAGGGAMIGLPMKGWTGTRALVGGVGGAMLAARLATMPWRRRRAARQQAEAGNAPQPAPQQDPEAQARAMGFRGLGRRPQGL